MNSAQAVIVLQHLRRLAGTRPADQPPDAQLLERFTAQRDEAAFAALVQRPGPMVLNVCRTMKRAEVRRVEAPEPGAPAPVKLRVV